MHIHLRGLLFLLLHVVVNLGAKSVKHQERQTTLQKYKFSIYRVQKSEKVDVIALNATLVRCGFFCTFANMKNKETQISASFHAPSMQGYMRMNMMFSDIIAVL